MVFVEKGTESLKEFFLSGPGCGGDSFTVLKNSLKIYSGQMQAGESALVHMAAKEFSFDADLWQTLAREASLAIVERRDGASGETQMLFRKNT